MALEVHWDLTLRGDGSKLDEFIETLGNNLAPGWTRDRESEARMADNSQH
jgi:hypothetical protein